MLRIGSVLPVSYGRKCGRLKLAAVTYPQAIPYFWNERRCMCAQSETVTALNVEEDKSQQVYRNPAHIQMISNELHHQIFNKSRRKTAFPEELIRKVETHLSSHSLWNQPVPPAPFVKDLKLPPLEGESIADHFKNIATSQASRYRTLIDELVHAKIPEMPKTWEMLEGWTKYVGESRIPVPFPDDDAYVFDVEVCMSNGHVPTIACAVSTTAWYAWCSPTLLAGVDRNQDDKIQLSDLIPFETLPGENNLRNVAFKEKLIIGHNVSYDRARIKEQYFLEETKLRFMDTMSLHIAVSGITSFQRALKMTMKKGLETTTPKARQDLMIAGSLEWNDISSLNNLKDVYKLYCNGKILDKETRSFFVDGNISDIRQNFQTVMTYCAKDVQATHEVLVNLMPSYFERFPSPVTLSGMVEMGMAYLPINSNWTRYINSSEETYHRLEVDMKSVLMQKAEEALKLLEGEKYTGYKSDPWLWDLDWKVTKPRKKNGNQPLYPAWYKKLFYKETDPDYTPGPSKISTSMRVAPKLLRLCWFGFPLHYSKKGGWGYLTKPRDSDRAKPESYYEAVDENVTSTDSDTAEAFATNEHGIDDEEEDTCAKFPYEDWLNIWEASRHNLAQRVQRLKDTTHTEMLEGHLRSNSEEAGQELKDFLKGLDAVSSIGLRKGKKGKGSFPRTVAGASPHANCEFIPLPHKDGDNFRVGNPLAKDFLNKILEGTLGCAGGEDIANKVVSLSKMVSYWRNNRDRIMGQVTVWMKPGELEFKSPADFEYGAILPQVSVVGTLTRRAVERTWMTASNAYVDRVGSELKGMIQAPPGFHFVGADVDSQELWIASVIGDADFAGIHGSTAFGWMVLQGTKSAGTDMHSKTAGLIGIDRDKAKILNYGRIYGAGVTYAERLLKQFNPQLSAGEARVKARTMYKMTKGQRKYLLNDEGLTLLESMTGQKGPLTKDDLFALLNSLEHPPIDYMDLVRRVVWDEGTESPMFNRLEEIAQMDCPVTPLLGCCISRSLVPSVVHQDFMTSRVNWVVQSSAVDYLHLMLTSMRWLFEKYGIKGRFSISVHDEVRYLVRSEDRYKAALALQITNLLTRSLCSYNLGMTDLPESVAFFSSVDIDKVLRKEVSDDCVTPSNPSGLSGSYDIPRGEGLTIFDLLTHESKSELETNQSYMGKGG